MKKKKVVLYGAGAVGVYFVGRLNHSQQYDVSFIVRSEFDHVSKHGYLYKSVKGDFKISPDEVNFVKNNASELDFKADYIFICTKVLANINYKKILSNIIDENTVFVLIQNGIGIEEIFAQEFPNNHIISSVAYIGTQRISTGNYSHYGGEGKLILGDYQLNSKSSKKDTISSECCKLNSVFSYEQVNVDASVTEDIIKTRYEKLCWNASFNTISVMGNHATTKNIMDCKESEILAANIMREVEAISIADNHAISKGYVEKMLEFARNFPEYKPSMLIDFEYDRPLEIKAIVSNAITKAEELNVNVPLLKMTEALLKLCDRRNTNN